MRNQGCSEDWHSEEFFKIHVHELNSIQIWGVVEGWELGVRILTSNSGTDLLIKSSVIKTQRHINWSWLQKKNENLFSLKFR